MCFEKEICTIRAMFIYLVEENSFLIDILASEYPLNEKNCIL